ncbi:mannose-ethanolamine phosphotransferase LAS21 KNAG_0C05830 [Huiozyma naganishii CBS 8797]|uniref:GPI ethanolamine phosphate transferase 2 n=1 Tax=Huiozyma naganishii (strain ATCC MYA-139 / BCRC 22969 / CBS 8797 / KCTC 17520 / NBRC 10181 / NCYC 3082 / Yp74L-3) TaxID=1071383 RepID=J7S6C8_HUIN7|nr:hypothetical protein KNAG_0C05830 [Kazachstania naganishii CBS 8797]CCK69681.1 hypothetical protein KNAG_0C05830 [Kazachstania naganishii CBS 8797]
MLGRLGAALILQLIAIFIFCLGFFPQKKVLKGQAEFNPENLDRLGSNREEPVFNKFILVVVDALRSDFIFDSHNSHFDFVHSKLNSGEAWGFTAFSSPPTVTLPRLKGITTGSTPNFLDALLNVAEDDQTSTIKEQDSWINQFLTNGNQSIRFFGDDTWLKLFAPANETFQEWEGTNSFFVSDFTQVDLNVTRHIPTQLQEKDQWDTLILHYLGLDHIGHKGGAYSHFMPEKHKEMDNVLKDLYENVDPDTLIVVMGDHGMNDVGNHGGSSPGETHAGLVFLSEKLSRFPKPHSQYETIPLNTPVTADGDKTFEYLTQVQQVDIVPTLATLFNVPIPKNSVGILIKDFIPLLDKHLREAKVGENYQQLFTLSNSMETVNVGLTVDEMYEKMRAVQENLTRNATDYNYRALVPGYVILVCVTAYCLILAVQRMRLSGAFVALLGISFLTGISMFGSSFVEEEHQLWWWVITGSILFTLAFRQSSWHTTSSCITLSLAVRLIRGWNNTGQKTTYTYVIGNILAAHPTIKWNLNVLAFLAVCQSNTESLMSFCGHIVLIVVALAYKINWALVNKENVPVYAFQFLQIIGRLIKVNVGEDIENLEEALIPLARVFYRLVLSFTVVKIVLAKIRLQPPHSLIKDISKNFVVLLMFLSSTSNIPQFLIFEIMKVCITQIIKDEYGSDISITAIVSLILQNFTFFQFGRTNSIATIDLSNAYHGISENYNIYAVGWLMVISNFAPALYWAIYPWNITYVTPTGICKARWLRFAKGKLPITLFNGLVGCCLLAACVALRYHLFIWSVFSPKLCYYVFWNLFMASIIGWALEAVLLLLV